MPKAQQANSFFTQQLLHWNETSNNRQMPWKHETDAYRIWLSEVILQQTRVEQGWHYYLRFIEKYPTIDRLASAPDDEVFKLWEGLGYYSRCRNLLAAARQVMNDFGGRFPDTHEAIQSLKGVGPYTAAAIASFAFGLPHAVVDGNVIRILARFFGIYTPFDTTAGKKEFAQMAASLLPADQPAAYNQALMDFGATVCKPRNPDCPNCPLQPRCKAWKTEAMEALPVRDKKIIRRKRQLHYFMVESEKGVLVRQRKAKDIWQGLYEFVLHESETETALSKKQVIVLANEATGLKLTWLQQLEPIVQQLTHQTLTIHFYRLKTPIAPEVHGYQWTNAKQLARLAFPRTLAMIVRQELAALSNMNG